MYKPRIISDTAPETIVGTNHLPPRVILELLYADPETAARAIQVLNNIETTEDGPFTIEDLDPTIVPNTKDLVTIRLSQVKFRTMISYRFLNLLKGTESIESARNHIKSYLEGEFVNNPLLFLELLKYFSQIDWFDFFEFMLANQVMRQSVQDVEELLKPQTLLIPMELERLIFLSAIEVVKENRNDQDWQNFIGHYLGSEVLKQIPDSILKLNSAGLPDLLPIIKKFELFISKFMGSDDLPVLENQPYERYRLLRDLFQISAKELYGSEYNSFFTKGGMDGFMHLIQRSLKEKPNTLFVMSKLEYPPIYYTIRKDQRILTSEIFDESEYDSNSIGNKDNLSSQHIENQIIDELYNKIEQYRQAEQVLPHTVVIVSSVPRGGSPKVNTNRLYQRIQDSFAGYPIKLWVDACQDGTPNLEGDVIVRSKLVGGTGGGLVQIKRSYMNLFDLEEGVKDSSGFPESVIMRLIGSIYCTKHRFGHELSDLLRRPKMWLYRGKGGYLTEELKKARNYFYTSEILSLNMEFLDEARLDGTTSSDEIVSLRPKSTSNLSIRSLAAILQKLKIDFTLFDLRGTYQNNPDFVALMNHLNEGDLDAELSLEEFVKYNQSLESLADFYKTWILHIPFRTSLEICSSQLTKRAILEYLDKEFKLNSAIRVKLKNTDRPDSLVEFFKRLEASIYKLITS